MSLYTGTEPADRDVALDLGARKRVAASYAVSAVTKATGVWITTSASGAGVSPVTRTVINNNRTFSKRDGARGWLALTAALMGLGAALLVIGLAASVVVGVSWAAGLFPIGATILFIATLVAGVSRKGGHSWGQN